ncbi:hypothetical protein MNBD_GAMMA16-1578 [hydrothermal vent metagenome]|uniref:FimV N-terminal domain-containing protein n=1 Tax=hydrothermal vent metagenome TaxID=652676 RepID=A0A3B0ZWE5_9ZZZZ
MQVLKSLVVGIGLLALSITQCYGLGLGDIELNSSLNQPLKAKIELLVVKPDELKQLKVRLADKAAYEAAGVERIHLLNDLVFKVIAVDGDKVVIEVTTVAPVREPFLDFIVEADWAAGRLLREYTLLLDPPVYAQERTVAVAAAQTTSQSSSPVEAVSSADTSSKTVSSKPVSTTSSAATRSTGQFTGNEYGPVKNNENLWNIAEKVRSDGLTTEQAMMGLFKMNPSAFSGANINNLQAGYVLRVPDAAAIQELSHSEAAKKARKHYNDWLAQRRIAAAASNQTPANRTSLAARAKASGAKPPLADSNAQLRLVSPEEGDGGLSGTDSEGLSSTDLARVQAAEEGSAAQALQARIQELENRLFQKERLLTLQNDALYELQQQLGSPKDLVQVTEFTDEDVANDPTIASFSDAAIRESGDVVANAEVGSEETAAETVATVEEVNPESTSSVTVSAKIDVQPEAVENNWLDLLEDTNILLLGVGVLLIIGAAVWSWVRRRHLQESFDASEYGLMPDELKMPVGDGEVSTVHTDMTDSDSFMKTSRIVPEEAESDIFVEETTAGLDSFETDDADIDPIAEADVYLAYRRYQQAEDLIKSALEEDPDSESLQIKLMEIYYGSENQLAFEAEAEAVFARHGGGKDVWSKIVEMGRELCPNHPLFGDAGAIDTPELESLTSESVDLDKDLDLGDLDLDSSGSGATSQNDVPVQMEDEISAEIAAEMDNHPDDLSALLDDLGDIENLKGLQGIDGLAVDMKSIDALDDTDSLDSLRDMNAEQTQSKEVESESSVEDFVATLDARPVAEDSSIDDVLGGLTPLDDIPIADEESNDIATLLEGLDDFSDDHSSPLENEKVDVGINDLAEPFEEIPSFDKEKAQVKHQAGSEAELSTENVLDFDSSEFAHSGSVIHGGGESDQSALNAMASDIDLGENSVEFDAEPQEHPVAEADTVESKPVQSSNESLSDEVVTQTADADIDFVEGLDLSGLGGDITSDDVLSDEVGADITPLSGAETADETENINSLMGGVDVEAFPDDIFAGIDAVGTKLDLARAYIEMEDEDGARGILEEVLEEGSDDQKQEAETIMHSMSANS